MKNFTYSRAATSEEALALISTLPNAKFLGGGTNLVDLMRENIEQPDALIDVTRLPSRGIAESADGGISIGAEVKTPQRRIIPDPAAFIRCCRKQSCSALPVRSGIWLRWGKHHAAYPLLLLLR